MSPYPHTAELERFQKDTADHTMTVLKDDGLYRHLRFKAPSTSMYWFDILTWPGTLTIDGDMGTWTFSRIDDMFEFFVGLTERDNHINPQYWEEKIRGARGGTREFSQARFARTVLELAAEQKAEMDPGQRPDFDRAIGELLSAGDDGEHAAREALAEFEWRGVRFEDSWELEFNEFTIHYLWSCHAIVHGIVRYRAGLGQLERLAAA